MGYYGAHSAAGSSQYGSSIPSNTIKLEAGKAMKSNSGWRRMVEKIDTIFTGMF